MTEQIVSRVLNYAFIINIALAIVVVFFERRKPTVTLAWILVLLFIPVLGFILYIFLGQDLRKKKLFFLKEGEEREWFPMLQQQDESLDHDKLVFNNIRVRDYRDMIHLHLYSNQSLFSQDNTVKVFSDGNELFQAMLEEISRAEKYIHIEYYIIRNDTLGREFLRVLCSKARQGVEVKLLYDGMGCLRLPRDYFQPLIDAGGRVASFFPPFLPYINLRINYRNHRKICLIDGRGAYIGGFNLGDEYRGLSKEFGFWRDAHLHIQGSAVDGLEVRFLLDWRYASHDKFISIRHYFPNHNSEGTTGVQIVSSGPDSQWNSIEDGYLKMISKAQRNIYIQTPYFVPDDSILETLKIAALSGLDVRVMIPQKKDHWFVYWASLSYLGELLEAGIRCYLYSENKGFLHSKVVLIDGFVSSVGTANMDLRSFKYNFEVNAFVYDEEVGNSLERGFIRDLDDCYELTLERYLDRSLIVRFKESVSRLLSPLL